MKHTSPARSVRPLADATGMSNETVEFALDMVDAVTRSTNASDGLPSAVAAGCLYAAALAVDGTNTAGARSRKPTPNRNWNPQVGHRRSDDQSTEMTISKAASITPASLRKHSREAIAIYLDSDAELADARARERLIRLSLR